MDEKLNKRLEQLKISKVCSIGNININLSLAIDAFNVSSNVNGANDYVICLLVVAIFFLLLFLHVYLLFLLL